MNDSDASNSPGIIIELFGAPGIGKSYLTKGLVEHFRANGSSVGDRSVVVGEMSRFWRIAFKARIIIPVLVLMPGMFRYLLSFILSAGVKRPAALIKVLVNWLYIVALIRWETRNYEIVILDQGIAQALWSTIFRGDNIAAPNITTELITNILQACGARQLVVVHISLESKTHWARLASRLNGSSPLDDGDPVKFERGLCVARSVGEIIEKLAGGNGCPMLSKLDFENDRSDNGYRLYKKLLDVFYSA